MRTPWLLVPALLLSTGLTACSSGVTTSSSTTTSATTAASTNASSSVSTKASASTSGSASSTVGSTASASGAPTRTSFVIDGQEMKLDNVQCILLSRFGAGGDLRPAQTFELSAAAKLDGKPTGTITNATLYLLAEGSVYRTEDATLTWDKVAKTAVVEGRAKSHEGKEIHVQATWVNCVVTA